MLNGIGGKTIAEAKRNIGLHEFDVWANYVALRGSLNGGRRTEVALAPLNYMVNRFFGGKSHLEDFMPHERIQAEPEKSASVEDVMGILFAARVK